MYIWWRRLQGINQKTLTLRESTAAYIMGIQPLKVALKE